MNTYILLTNNLNTYNQIYYTDFNLINANLNSSISNNPAYELTFTDKLGKKTMKTMQLGSIIGNKIFIIQYYTEIDKFPLNLPIVNTMIKSLHIAR